LGKLTSTPFLVLFILLGAVGVGAASALVTITLAGDVAITDGGTLSIGTDDPNDDDIIKFDDGTKSLKWNNNLGEFEFNTELLVAGNLFLIEDLSIGEGSGDDDDTIFFDEEADGKTLKWDNTDDRFEFSNDLEIQGDLICSDCVDSGDIADPILGDLSCSKDQVAFWTGSVWQCGNATLRRDVVRAIDAPPMGFKFANNVDSAIAIGTDNFAVIVYYDDQNDSLKFIKCLSVDCSLWKPGITLDGPGVGEEPSVAIGTDGFPVISYQKGTGLGVIHCTKADCSMADTPEQITINDDALDTSIAIGTDNNPVISYFGGNEDLLFVHCTSTDCSTNDASITMDSTGAVGEDTSIMIGDDNFPIISYADADGTSLKIIHCTILNCSMRDAPRVLDSVGEPHETSITKGTDGNAIVAYADNDTGPLRVVHCTNVSCSASAAAVTLDSEGFTDFASIAIGNDGFPVVSYFSTQFTENNLRMIHCTSVNCSTSDDSILLDGPEDVGADTAIAVPSGGSPVISYLDFDNGDLKMVSVGGIIIK